MKQLLTLLTLVTLAGPLAAQTAAPTLIPFQGRLTDQNGVAYTNNQYTIVFQLYDQAVGGTLLWSERHEKVGVLNGMVNVFLGSIATLTNVSFSSTRYLGITVDGDNNPNTPDPEMVPRQMIIPAFWAKQADNATKMGNYTWTDLLGSANPTLGIPGSRLQAGSIPAAQLVPSSITAAQISASAITSATIADGAIVASKLAPRAVGASVGLGGFAMSASGPYTNMLLNLPNYFPDLSTTPLTNVSVTITTTNNRPVYLSLIPIKQTLGYLYPNAALGNGFFLAVVFKENGVPIAHVHQGFAKDPTVASNSRFSPGCFNTFYIPTTAGVKTYTVEFGLHTSGSNDNTGSNIQVQNVGLIAFEL